MAQCITCGTELHPERAAKYSYCMARECQEANASGLTMVAIGMNKAAEEFLILDDQTRADMASGRYRDQRRGSFGPAATRPDAARISDTSDISGASRRGGRRAGVDPVPATTRTAV